MSIVAIDAAGTDGPAPPGLRAELARDPYDLWQTITAAEGKPCGRRDPDEFFPLPGAHTPDNARRLCTDPTTAEPCPVRAACLAYALKTGEESSGIWGGTTPRERTALRHRFGGAR